MKPFTHEGVDRTQPLVYLQQACVPHYRQPFYEKLGAEGRLHFVVLADPQAEVPFLRLSDGANGYEFDTAKQYLLKLPFGAALSWQPCVVKKLWRDRPDVVVAQGSPYDVTAWTLTLLGRLLDIPVLLWTHGLQGEESGLKWVVRASLYRLAKGLLLYGDHANQLLIAKGFPADRLHVVYNSLDVEEQEAVFRTITPAEREAFRCSLGVREDERLICFTGRLQPVKRLPWLLQALSLVEQRGRRVHLVLVGDGSERTKLERLSHELGLDGLVHFLGALYDELRLGPVISSSDLAVVPSGAGLSVMHALAYGTPVLLHNRVEEHFPEWEAVREGETGWFYRYGDLSDCANKIIEALFPQPRKVLMESACRSIIDGRYNAGAHAQRFIQAVAEYCPPDRFRHKLRATSQDSVISAGSIGRTAEGDRR